MASRRYYQAIVRDNRDPEQRGRLRLEVPELLGPGVVSPDWVAPRITAPQAGAVGWLCIPATGATVVLEANGPGHDPAARGWRWQGSEALDLPQALRAGYPARAGATSPDGSAVAVLGPDLAALLASTVRLGASEQLALHEVVRATLLVELGPVLTELVGLIGLPAPLTTALVSALAANAHRSASVRVD